MKKNVLIRVSCLAVAATVLVSALAVAAYLGSPYETLKKAVFDAMVVRNVTIEGAASISVNGEVWRQEKSFAIHGDTGYLSQSFDRDGNPSGFHFSTDGLFIHPTYTASDGTQWYYADTWPHRRSNRGTIVSMTPEERNSAAVRFAEVLIDAVVGNLKNNITMSSQNGIRRVQATLTESQVPELLKLGIDLMLEQSGYHYLGRRDIGFNGTEIMWEVSHVLRGMKTVATYKQPVRVMTDEDRAGMRDGSFWDNKNHHFGTSYFNGVEYVITGWQEPVSDYTVPVTPADFDGYEAMSIPMSGLTIHYARGEAEIDSDGNLLSVDVSGSATAVSIFGESNLLELQVLLTFSDIGTSDPSSPVPGVKELLTPEFMTALMGHEYGGVYFTLNNDGSINAASVTTMHPGEQYGWADEDYISYRGGWTSSISYMPPQPVQVQVDSVDVVINERRIEPMLPEQNGYDEDEPWY
jgi:hypothetical protein